MVYPWPTGLYTRTELDSEAGTNYLVCNARASHNYYAFLSYPTGTYDADIVETELDFFSGLNIKHLRIFQSPYGYFANKENWTGNLADFTQKCFDRDIKFQLEMFDGVALGRINVDFLLNPSLEVVGPVATGKWDPLAATNPYLINGEATGVLDALADYDRASHTGAPQPDGFTYGGWMDSPGGFYLGTRDYPEYPAHPEEPVGVGFWSGLIDYVDSTICAVTGTASGVLHSVDIMNEPEVTFEYWQFSHDPVNYPEYYALFDESMPNSLEANTTRNRGFLFWWMDYIQNEKPTVPITVGCVSVSYATNWAQAQDASGKYLDIITAHDYSHGKALGSIAAGLNYVGYVVNRPACLSEFFRNSSTDESILWAAYNLQRRGVMGYMWEILETPAFGAVVETVQDWGNSNPPEASAYPDCGLARSMFTGDDILTVDHGIIDRRPDITSVLSSWFAKDTFNEPEYYTLSGDYKVENGSNATFTILDNTGAQLSVGANDILHVRYMSTPLGSYASPIWKRAATEAFAFVPGAGNQVNGTFAAITGSASGTFTIDGTAGQEVFILSAFLLSEDYDINRWDLVQCTGIEPAYSSIYMNRNRLGPLTWEAGDDWSGFF